MAHRTSSTYCPGELKISPLARLRSTLFHRLPVWSIQFSLGVSLRLLTLPRCRNKRFHNGPPVAPELIGAYTVNTCRVSMFGKCSTISNTFYSIETPFSRFPSKYYGTERVESLATTCASFHWALLDRVTFRNVLSIIKRWSSCILVCRSEF